MQNEDGFATQWRRRDCDYTALRWEPAAQALVSEPAICGSTSVERSCGRADLLAVRLLRSPRQGRVSKLCSALIPAVSLVCGSNKARVESNSALSPAFVVCSEQTRRALCLCCRDRVGRGRGLKTFRLFTHLPGALSSSGARAQPKEGCDDADKADEAKNNYDRGLGLGEARSGISCFGASGLAQVGDLVGHAREGGWVDLASIVADDFDHLGELHGQGTCVG